MVAIAIQMAEKKVSPHRSWRVATRRHSLMRLKAVSMQ
jgi:hypothetical protein